MRLHLGWSLAAVAYGITLFSPGQSHATTYDIAYIEATGHSNTEIGGINDLGQIVGTTLDGSYQAYVATNGVFTTIPSIGGGMSANGINNSGVVIGTYWNTSYDQGFIYASGVTVALQVPGAIITIPLSINNSGAVTGIYDTYLNNTYQQRSFTYADGAFTTGVAPLHQYSPVNGTPNPAYPVIDIPIAEAGSTYSSGINANGVVVGSFVSTVTGNFTGFVATPVAVPEPASTAIFGMGLIGLHSLRKRRGVLHG